MDSVPIGLAQGPPRWFRSRQKRETSMRSRLSLIRNHHQGFLDDLTAPGLGVNFALQQLVFHLGKNLWLLGLRKNKVTVLVL